MTTISILGSGCANCRRLEDVARAAVAALGIEATFEKVSDHEAILAHDVLSTPGLVIDGRVMSQGRIPAVETVKGWLRDCTAAG